MDDKYYIIYRPLFCCLKRLILVLPTVASNRLIIFIGYAILIAMKTTFTQLPKSQAKIIVKMSAKEVSGHVEKVIEKYAQHVEAKGFRKGHTPKIMVIDHIGLGRLQQETLDSALQDGYIAALKEHKFHSVSQPAIAVKKFSVHQDGSVSEDLEYELTLDLMPKISLGDYSKIRVSDKKLFHPDISVSQDEVDKIIEHLRRQKSTMEDVSQPVAKGNWIEISFRGSVNGVEQEKLVSDRHPLIVGSGALVPGFEDALVGMKKDKKKTITITFPKDYYAKDFAGKKADFKVTLHAIKNIILPKIDAAFAKEFGHETVSALRQAIADQLVLEKKAKSRQLLEAAILDQAKKLLKVTLPDGLVDQETERIIHRMKETVEKQGVEFERYLESQKKTHDDLHKELQPQARANIEVGLMLGEVIQREKLDLEDKEAPQKALEKLVAFATKQN